MEAEIINATWPGVLRFEPSIDASDITSGDMLGSIENIPKKAPHRWRIREWFAMWLPRTKNIDSLECGLYFVSQPIIYPEEEYLQLEQIPCEPYNRGYYKVFIHEVSGVVWTTTSKIEKRISVTVAPDVVAESEAKGLTDELETAIELAKTIYTSLRKIDLLLEKDPEIPDRETLRFILTVSGNPEQILEEESNFKRHIRNKIRQHTRENITITYYWK